MPATSPQRAAPPAPQRAASPAPQRAPSPAPQRAPSPAPTLASQPVVEAGSTAGRILDAAEVCFARRGYDGTTLREVAEIVGIRIPSLYNHFDSKQSLYTAVLARGMAPILEMLTRSVAGGDGEAGGDPRNFVNEVMAVLAERPNLPRLIQYEMLAGGDNLALMLEAWLRPTMTRSLELLRDTPAARHWKPEQLPHLLLALVNMLIGHFAMTPLTELLIDEDVHDETALARATGFYARAATLLTFGDAAPALPESPPSPSQETRP